MLFEAKIEEIKKAPLSLHTFIMDNMYTNIYVNY